MAMRCFGRAFDAVFDFAFTAALGLAVEETRPFDLMVLRDEDLAALARPVQFSSPRFWLRLLLPPFAWPLCLPDRSMGGSYTKPIS